METSNAKIRVGFGRTEVSVRLDCIVSCAFSYGHGPRNPGVQGFCKRSRFHFLLVHVVFDFGNHHENCYLRNAKTRVGSARAEVSVRLDCVVVCALSFGHSPRNPGFQGFCKRLDFHAFVHGLF